MSEGVVRRAEDVANIVSCAGATGEGGSNAYDVVDVRLASGVALPDITLERNVCTAVLPDRLRAAQPVFDRTGGLHAAGLFSPEGDLLDLREDVGRRNAVDKLIGRALQSGELPLSRRTLPVSGRVSFEPAQKAVMAGVPMPAAVSAPSSLAVDLAAETGLTLIGFLRGGSMNVYAGEQRLALPAGATARAPQPKGGFAK